MHIGNIIQFKNTDLVLVWDMLTTGTATSDYIKNNNNNIIKPFFTLIFGDNFLFFILAKCVGDKSCKEKLAPTSPNGSNI